MMLKHAHRVIFEEVFDPKWVGRWRDVNITKAEEVLNGRSVNYAAWALIPDQMDYDFSQEKTARYSCPMTPEQIAGIIKFTSAIWQTHPFRDGNTRAVALFLQLYLASLGATVTNEPFKEHAKFFRDALVRANYSDISMGVEPDGSFLQLFFENLVAGGEHRLGEIDLRCVELFE